MLGPLATALLTVWSIACSPLVMPEVSNAVPVASKCESSSESRYFPAEFRWLPTGQSALTWTRGPSTILEAMQEPPLSCGDAPESYRILWLHSFSSSPPTIGRYPPTMVRMSWNNGRYSVTAVQLASFLNRKELVRRERLLSGEEDYAIFLALKRFEFWTRRDFTPEPGANDGELWVVEGRRDKGYHRVFLPNVDREACRALAVVFLKTAGLDPKLLDGRDGAQAQ